MVQCKANQESESGFIVDEEVVKPEVRNLLQRTR